MPAYVHGYDPLAHVGRRLFPLLTAAGVADVRVSPRLVSVDASRPELVEGFIRRTSTAMVAGVRDDALAAGLLAPDAFAAGIRDLHRTAEPDGVFTSTSSKAVGTRR